MANALYDWSSRLNPADFLLEGNGELLVTEEKELVIRTFHMGPQRKATNVWLRNVTLPGHFRLSFRYKSNSVAGNTMVIFHANPFRLPAFFDDNRPDARYCDIASWKKIVAYTVGFHRGAYNNPSVLRKIGGDVPESWGMAHWPSEAWHQMDQVTRFHTTQEPIGPGDKGKFQEFVLERREGMKFFVNGVLVHDEADRGQYPYHKENLSGGYLGFRNFGGPADDVYSRVVVEAI